MDGSLCGQGSAARWLMDYSERVVITGVGLTAPNGDSLEAFRLREGISYDLIHSHYWLSGVVARRLKARWGTPVLQMFHTLGRLKNSVARSMEERESFMDHPGLQLGQLDLFPRLLRTAVS